MIPSLTDLWLGALTYYIQGKNNTKTLFFFFLRFFPSFPLFFCVCPSSTPPYTTEWAGSIYSIIDFFPLFLPWIWCVYPSRLIMSPWRRPSSFFFSVLVVNFKLCPACYIFSNSPATQPLAFYHFPFFFLLLLVIDATLATVAIPSNNRFAFLEW
jgi:hypothetical protein